MQLRLLGVPVRRFSIEVPPREVPSALREPFGVPAIPVSDVRPPTGDTTIRPTGQSLGQIAAPHGINRPAELEVERYKSEMIANQEALKQLQAENAVITGLKPLFDKYIEVKKREYDFQAAMMTVNERTFLHQIVASYVILGLVVFVVGSALYFAYVQLMAGVVRPLPVEGSSGASGAAGTTTLDVSYQKVTVSSSVVGIIVLVISLAFLYIYTHEIFHLELIDPYKPKAMLDAGAIMPIKEVEPKAEKAAKTD